MINMGLLHSNQASIQMLSLRVSLEAPSVAVARLPLMVSLVHLGDLLAQVALPTCLSSCLAHLEEAEELVVALQEGLISRRQSILNF